jgi:hypothetical protein
MQQQSTLGQSPLLTVRSLSFGLVWVFDTDYSTAAHEAAHSL